MAPVSVMLSKHYWIIISEALMCKQHFIVQLVEVELILICILLGRFASCNALYFFFK